MGYPGKWKGPILASQRNAKIDERQVWRCPHWELWEHCLQGRTSVGWHVAVQLISASFHPQHRVHYYY